jgi:hypothetical protein
LVLQLVFPGRVNRNFPMFCQFFYNFPLFFHLGYCVKLVLQLGRVSPHVNGVDFGFNRWLNSYSRCELK